MARKVYVTRIIPEAGIDMLREHTAVEVNESDRPLSKDALRQRSAENDALVTLLTDQIDRGVLEAGKGRLKIVANVAVGYDNIDLDAATKLGIMVSNTPGVLTETTADFAWTLLMAVARRVCEGDAFFRAGKYHGWGILLLLGADVHHKTLGLIGFGRIGQAVARRATGFDMRILFYDPITQAEDIAAQLGAESVDLDTMLRESDFISIHTPLTAETRHLIGKDQLEAMKPTAFLINTSRGPVVDEAALVDALKTKQIAGAALDVYENEPQAAAGLTDLQNVVLAPHIASASSETRSKMATIAAENVIAALDGNRPPTLLNSEVLGGS